MRWLAVALALWAVPAAAQECPLPGQTPKLVVQMFFSGSAAGQGPISVRAWQRFLADTVTPKLPDGFTVYDAYGQWMDPRTQRISRELTKVVVVAADDRAPFRAAIGEVTEAYRKRFAQQVVGVLTSSGCGAF